MAEWVREAKKINKTTKIFLIAIAAASFFNLSCSKKILNADVRNIPAGGIIVDGKVDDWEASGISVLDGLEWEAAFAGFEGFEKKGIQSLRIARDKDNIFLLLEIIPGVEEHIEKNQSTGHIGYIYLDVDGSESTGARRNTEDEYHGWDYRIYLPIGFIGASGAGPVKPAAWYQVERITSDSEYEEIKGGSKSSYEGPASISFAGNYLEIKFPFILLGISPPTEIKLVIEDLKVFPQAETQLNCFLKK